MLGVGSRVAFLNIPMEFLVVCSIDVHLLPVHFRDRMRGGSLMMLQPRHPSCNPTPPPLGYQCKYSPHKLSCIAAPIPLGTAFDPENDTLLSHSLVGESSRPNSTTVVFSNVNTHILMTQ